MDEGTIVESSADGAVSQEIDVVLYRQSGQWLLREQESDEHQSVRW